MADLDQRPGSKQLCVWRQSFLDRKIPRTLSRPSALPGVGQNSRKHVHNVSRVAEASCSRLLLECDGSQPGTVSKDQHSDPNDYRSIRCRPAWSYSIL